MYTLIISCNHRSVLTLCCTLDELQTFARTVTESGCGYELIKNKRSMFFEDIEELRLFLREV